MGIAVTNLRPMTFQDVARVAAIEISAQPTPWSEQVFRDELSADNRVYRVADSNGVIGFGGIMVIGDEAHVTNLVVAPSHRSQGLGRRLLAELIEVAIEQGARHLTLEVRAGNEPARNLYAAIGMVPVGLRPGYYGDDDALIMWAHDIDRPEYLERLR